MSACRKCGLPLAFKRMPNGKLRPTNPDGSDHWDLCSQTRWKASGRKNVEFGARTKGKVKKADHYVYSGSVPPWDESLGEFRLFTEAEKLAGEVCERRP